MSKLLQNKNFINSKQVIQKSTQKSQKIVDSLNPESQNEGLLLYLKEIEKAIKDLENK